MIIMASLICTREIRVYYIKKAMGTHGVTGVCCFLCMGEHNKALAFLKGSMYLYSGTYIFNKSVHTFSTLMQY